jgi:tetratricopeptide (TPR) repeat protein
MRRADVVRAVFAGAAKVGLASLFLCSPSFAWQLTPVEDKDLPSLEQTPDEAPQLLSPRNDRPAPEALPITEPSAPAPESAAPSDAPPQRPRLTFDDRPLRGGAAPLSIQPPALAPAAAPVVSTVEPPPSHEPTDLEFAPENLSERALEAETLLASNRAAEALATADEGLRTAPQNSRWRLIRGKALLALGRWDEAAREAEAVSNRSGAAVIHRAAARLLQGDCLALSPQHDVRAAMEHHFQAAQLATTAVQEAMRGGPAVASPEAAEALRREALWTAMEAYLAIAADVAEGRWRKREETFAQWIDHAERTVASLAPADVKEDWSFYVRCRALEASAASGGKVDPAPYAAAALEGGARLIAAAPDAQIRADVQAQLGVTLFESSQKLTAAGQREAARNCLFDGQRLLEAAVQQPGGSRDIAYLLGRIYFVLGFDHAAEEDHTQAAKWYAKAAPLLEGPLPPSRLAEAGVHGERLVSMGVSFWQTQQREQALALTEKGLRYIQQAVDQGQLDRSALTVPLNNLTNMNRALGNTEQAERYHTRLVDFQTPADEK